MGFVFLYGLNTYSCRAGPAHAPEARPRHDTMSVPGRALYRAENSCLVPAHGSRA